MRHKVRDKVRITRRDTHKFEIGEEVEIEKVFKDYYEATNGSQSWHIDDTECEPIKNTIKAKRKDLESIVNLPVCPEWQKRITSWCKNKPFGKYIELTEQQVNDMFKDALTAKKSKELAKILNRMFPYFQKEEYSFEIGDKFTIRGIEFVLAKPNMGYSSLICLESGNNWAGMVNVSCRELTLKDFQELCDYQDAKEIYKTKH